MNSSSFKAVGIAMLVLGIAFLVLGFAGGPPAFRLTGPVLAFFGIVLLTRARRLSS